MGSKEISVSCHENAVPSFVRGKLEELYGSMYASFAQFSVYGGLEQANTYVAQEEGSIKDILLYRHQGSSVHVINEQIRLNSESVKQFAGTIFRKYPEVNAISLHAVELQGRISDFPTQQYTCTNDISMVLPGTVQEYHASLGKSTRKTLNQNLNRMQRRYPSFRFHAYLKDEIQDQHLHRIIEMNRARMAGKSRISAIDDEEADRIISFTKICGLTGVVTIDGHICAGAICYRIGNHYFLRVIAHDPQYNASGLGMLCCYLTICECINRGGTEYHFMWGQEEYKYRLLGSERGLSHIVIYRSRLHMLMNAGMVLRNAGAGSLTEGRLWVLERLRHKDTFSGRLLAQAINLLHYCRRTVSSIQAWRKPQMLQLSQKK